VVRRDHAPDVFAVARRGMEFQRQRFRAFELTCCHEQLANAGERAVDECVVTEAARELEVLLEQLKRPRLLSGHVKSPAKRVAGHCKLCLVFGSGPELDRLLVSAQRLRLVDVDRSKGGQRPSGARSVLCG
jgi:hypothetical protein